MLETKQGDGIVKRKISHRETLQPNVGRPHIGTKINIELNKNRKLHSRGVVFCTNNHSKRTTYMYNTKPDALNAATLTVQTPVTDVYLERSHQHSEGHRELIRQEDDADLFRESFPRYGRDKTLVWSRQSSAAGLQNLSVPNKGREKALWCFESTQTILNSCCFPVRTLTDL